MPAVPFLSRTLSLEAMLSEPQSKRHSQPHLQPITLVRGKLNRPPVTSRLVPRPRLGAILAQGLFAPLTLVCAGAGFGKTTLVSSWLSSAPSNLPGAWLTLDENDSDLSTFLSYFVAALRTLFADACAETLALIQAPHHPPAHLLRATLSNDLLQLPGPFVIVLDDYQVLDGKAVHDLVADLLRHWPAFMHMVLISRHTPPLPLARLRAAGQLVEVRSQHLRFTHEEVGAYLERVLDRPLSEPALTRLEQKTDGWIAGVQLVTLSLAETRDPEAFLSTLASADANVADYLVDEVLSRQPVAIQKFLLTTSVLDRFNAAACEAVMEGDNPGWSIRECLDHIERANLFVTALDSQRQWYRYHPLFQDLLQQKLHSEMGSDAVARLHRRAAAWFAGQNLIEEAARHSKEGNDFEQVALAIERGLVDVLNREDRQMLERWLQVLPEDLVRRRPGLRMVKIWTLHFSWQLGALEQELQQVEQMLAESEALMQVDDVRYLRGQLCELNSQAAFFANAPARSIAYARQAFELLPSAWAFPRGGAILYQGLSMQAMGQGQDAEEALLEQYGSLHDRLDGYALRHLMSLGFVYLFSGQLDKARENAHVLLRQASLSGLPTLQGWAQLFLGTVSFHRNDLESARRYFAEIAEARYKIHALIPRDGLAGLALVQFALGETAETWQTLETLRQLDLDRMGYEGDHTRSLRARLLIMSGDAEGAGRWADESTAPVQDRPLLWLEEPRITRARVLIARNSGDDARRALEALETLYESAERTYKMPHHIEILALQALALDALGDTQPARATLREAVALSVPGGFVRIFVELGPPMARMLEEIARETSAGVAKTIGRILVEFPKPSHPADSLLRQTGPGIWRSELVEPLTERELDVLKLMAERRSDKEIAAALTLSPLTVKRHAINIYAKLNVHGRWDAVVKAEELGILNAKTQTPTH